MSVLKLFSYLKIPSITSCISVCPHTHDSLWPHEAYQASPSMGFSRQEYRSGLPFPSPGALPDSGIEPQFPALQADDLPSEPPGKPNIYATST